MTASTRKAGGGPGLRKAGLGEGGFGPKIKCVRTRLHDKCRQGELGMNFSKEALDRSSP